MAADDSIAIVRAFDDSNELVRREAVRAARHLTGDFWQSLRFISVALPDEDTIAHLRAIDLLRGPVANAVVFLRSRAKRHLRPSLAGDLRNAVTSALGIDQGHSNDARSVAGIIARQLGRVLVPELIAILESGKYYAPSDAANVLAALGRDGKPGCPALLRLLSDERQPTWNRSAAACAFTRVAMECRMGVPHALISSLKVEAIRFEVGMCLRQFMLANDGAVRAVAANALATEGLDVRGTERWSAIPTGPDIALGPPDSVSRTLETSRVMHPRRQLRLVAPVRPKRLVDETDTLRTLITRLKRRPGSDVLTRALEGPFDEALEALVVALAHDDPDVRAEAAGALSAVELGTDQSGRAVASALFKALDDPPVSTEAASALRWQPVQVKEGIPRRYQRRVASALPGGGSLS